MKAIITVAQVEARTIEIRRQRVMLDADPAQLHEGETRVLVQALDATKIGSRRTSFFSATSDSDCSGTATCENSEVIVDS